MYPSAKPGSLGKNRKSKPCLSLRLRKIGLTGAALWERMNRAVEKVQGRLEKTVRTWEAVGIPYGIIGGNAVRACVAQ
jgi:hypothetical protein